MRFTQLLPLLLALPGALNAQPLSGNLTVDPGQAESSTNFTTVTAALSALTSRGVDGPVTFTVAAGTYSGPNAVTPVPGIQAKKAVVFRSASGNPADVIWSQTASSSSDNYVVYSLSKHFRFEGITFQATGNLYALVLNIAADSIQFKDCRFLGKLNANANNTTENLVKIAGSATRFEDCTFSGGAAGLVLDSKDRKGTVISGCRFSDAASLNPIQIKKADGLIFSGNTVELSSSSVNFIGVELMNCYGALTVEKNLFRTGNGCAMRLSDCYGSDAGRLMIRNNMFYASGSSADQVLRLSNAQFTDVFNNTVYLNSPGAALYTNDGQSLKLVNNLFINPGLGRAISVGNGNAVTDCDYNGYFSGNQYRLATWGGTDAANLTALQTANGKDSHSLVKNVTFFSGYADLHLGTGSSDLAGLSLAEVPDDFDGEIRSGSPFRGADEFSGTYVSVRDGNQGEPGGFRIYPNYPNPFNPSTAIRFYLPVSGEVRISVVDLAGRLVETLVSGYRAAGEQIVRFEADHLAGGVYFCRIESESGSGAIKLILLK